MTRDETSLVLRLTLKRAIDVIGAVLVLIIAAPLMVVTAIAIPIGSSGSPFFVQTRAGLRGEPFRIYKFRTMVRDAEHGGPVMSMSDPRVTRLGRFLRRTSIDELPQLVNVIRGDMSLVGPRPQLIGTTRPVERRRFDMRPGMTGLVEVSGPHLLSWDERMALDIRYVEEWSIAMDLRILLRTLPVVFSRQDILDLPRTDPVDPQAAPE